MASSVPVSGPPPLESAVPHGSRRERGDAASLVERSRHGDAAAFGALIEGHYDLIFATAYRWVGSRADAEDIAQDVCVKLATALASFDGRAAFSTWIYRVTLNAVRDHQRAGRRRRGQMQTFADEALAHARPEQEDRVAAGDLWRAVRALPERQRDAVLLIYAEELTHAAAAAIMGCGEITVSWHVHQAKKALKGLLT